MGVGVVADDMSGSGERLGERGILPRPVTPEEELRLDVVALEGGENRGQLGLAAAVVEGQPDVAGGVVTTLDPLDVSRGHRNGTGHPIGHHGPGAGALDPADHGAHRDDGAALDRVAARGVRQLEIAGTAGGAADRVLPDRAGAGDEAAVGAGGGDRDGGGLGNLVHGDNGGDGAAGAVVLGSAHPDPQGDLGGGLLDVDGAALGQAETAGPGEQATGSNRGDDRGTTHVTPP
jgi:hypothetical protein